MTVVPILVILIVKLQKCIVRIVSSSKYKAHTEPIFKTLKLLKIKDILRLQELKFYYKYENDKLPYYLANLPFSTNTSIDSPATRRQNKIHLFKPNHEYAKHCIIYDIPTVINSTPNNIIAKIYTQLARVSGYIKQHFLQSYQEGCTIINYYICSRT